MRRVRKVLLAPFWGLVKVLLFASALLADALYALEGEEAW